jgi:hypothetical protein
MTSGIGKRNASHPGSPNPQTPARSPEELQQLAATGKPIDGPVANASTVLLSIAGNDAILVFNRPRPVIMPDGSMPQVAVAETTAIIHVSMATLKDLSLLLNGTIQQYEKNFGEIETEYTRRLAAEK